MSRFRQRQGRTAPRLVVNPPARGHTVNSSAIPTTSPSGIRRGTATGPAGNRAPAHRSPRNRWPAAADTSARDDHEKIHTGQVLKGRYESRITASPMQRLIAEWLVERARFIGSLVGLTDEQFNAETAPGQWTYRVVANHVLAIEQDSRKTMAADRAARPSAG
jgi:hypothetical protein